MYSRIKETEKTPTVHTRQIYFGFINKLPSSDTGDKLHKMQKQRPKTSGNKEINAWLVINYRDRS